MNEIQGNTWVKEITEKALEYGYQELTISVVNSWCNEIFKLGCDLLNAKLEKGVIAIFARMQDGGQEVILKIEIELKPELPKLSVTLSRYVGEEVWTYRTFLSPYLTHFMLFARRSGMFSFN